MNRTIHFLQAIHPQRIHFSTIFALTIFPVMTGLLSGFVEVDSTVAIGADSIVVPGQNVGWTRTIEANLTQTQNAYSDNWNGSEAGSVSWAFNLNGSAEKSHTPRINSKHTLKLAFGQTHSQIKATHEWVEPAVATDRIEWESIGKLTVGAPVDPFLSGRLESKFLDARTPLRTIYFNPVTISESVGLSRTLFKDEEKKRDLTARAGFSIRQKYDANALLDTLNLKFGRDVAHDGGLEIVSDLTMPITPEKLNLTGRVILFQALYSSIADENNNPNGKDAWQAMDVNAEATLAANVTRYVMVNLYTQLLYDKEIDKAGQFKETLALGLTYSFH